MGSKAAFLLGAGVGYVLGTKAGRARYEQIKNKADHFMQDERVQSAVATAKDKLGDVAGAAGGAVKDKVAETASEAGEALKSKVSSLRHHDDESDSAEAPAPPPSAQI
ncbi:hypothetical protein ATL41_2601 [Flavimobilis soli]|uniref:YtxH-like protein n=1 Tax=Flavimobilis soli TaxID=442709 RepID=A0A2A9EHV3_9MICO|nr:YtxH domain-containing protein [Flavimobilis soli]PFG37822.1 hypothetical protein ATL41_2601 [Flavimobilis soli]